MNDTLGWVYHKKGLGTQAVAALQEAVDKEPRNPLFRNAHLGMAHEAQGDHPKARAALQKALGTAADFDGAAKRG